ncbi:MAG: helix-turn-helix domain-containing protein [Leptospirales bacterium]
MTIAEIRENLNRVREALEAGAKVRRVTTNIYLKSMTMSPLPPDQRLKRAEPVFASPVIEIPGPEEWLTADHIGFLSQELEKYASANLPPINKQVFFDMVNNFLRHAPKKDPVIPTMKISGLKSGQEKIEKEFFTEAEAAEFLNYDKKTFERMRKLGTGPAFSKPTPRGIRYMKADLISWNKKFKQGPSA